MKISLLNNSKKKTLSGEMDILDNISSVQEDFTYNFLLACCICSLLCYTKLPQI